MIITREPRRKLKGGNANKEEGEKRVTNEREGRRKKRGISMK